MERYISIFEEENLDEAFIVGSKPSEEGGRYLITKGLGRDPDDPKGRKYVQGWFKTKNPAKPTKPKNISKSAAKKRARLAVRTKSKKGARAKKLQIKKMLQTKKKNKQIK